jgi:hypothetical protein
MAFGPGQEKWNTIKLVFVAYSQTALKSKNKDWLTQNQGNVSD